MPVRTALPLLALAGFSTLASSVHGGNVAAPISCSFGAFVEEHDPAGLNVRAAPSSSAKVLGKLPPVWVDPERGHRTRVEVEITAAQNGWFRIRNAVDNEDMSGRPARPLYQGDGWVSGSKLIVKSQAKVGRERPSSKAAEVLRVGDDESFDNDVMMNAGRLVDCAGVWARLEFAQDRLKKADAADLQVAPAARQGLPPGRFRAWVNRICAIQETSCSGFDAANEE